MKRILLISSILILSQFVSLAQNVFQKEYSGLNDGLGQCARQTADGGFVMTGSTNSIVAGNSDIYFIKTNASGDTLWARTFAGVNEDYGATVQQTFDGGYILAGTTNSFGAGGYDICLIKTDSVGNLVWCRALGGTSDDYTGDIYAFYDGENGFGESAVEQTSDSGFIIAGTSISFGDDVYLIKTDRNGTVLWSKTFGGSNEETAFSVQQTVDGGYILSGFTTSYPLSPVNLSAIFLIKTDAAGTLVWSKAFDMGLTYNNKGYSIQQTLDHGFIVTGTLSGSGLSGSGSESLFILRTDSNGSVLWANNYDGSSVYYARGACIRQTRDGGFIAGGWGLLQSYGAALLIKTDVNGLVQWSKYYGNSFSGYFLSSVRQASDTGFILAGTVYSSSLGSYDVCMIKTDSLGNSGCYQGNAGMIVFPVVVTASNVSPVSSNPATINTLFAMNSGNGVTVLDLCSSTFILEEPKPGIEYIDVFPNPVKESATIRFRLDQAQKVSLRIVDLNGRLVSILSDKIFQAGENRVEWNADVRDGIYFMHMQTDEITRTEKLIVLR